MKTKLFSMFSFIVAGLLITGCNSENITDNPVMDQNKIEEENVNKEITTLGKSNIKLFKELTLAIAASAKYNNIENAIKDGYADINVIVQNMGYHYMKIENVNAEFDPARPELLVYSKNPNNGRMRLVAVEYAVPNTEPRPEGFSGDYDEWVNNTDFGLWLLHAWVWYYNPDGLFNPMNPRVNVEEGEITYP